MNAHVMCYQVDFQSFEGINGRFATSDVGDQTGHLLLW